MDTDWHRALARFGSLLEADDRSETITIVREMHAALRVAPEQVRRAMGAPCDTRSAECLLAAGAPRELAFRLLDGASYLLTISRGDAGRVLASLEMADLFGEAHGAGPDEATAIVAALASGLARLSVAAVEPDGPVTHH